MARHVRLEYPGAFYHVMCRGDRRGNIFRDDTDREIWMATWAQDSERSGFLTHAWVLMSNHYHALVETPAGNLVDGMRWFQSTYTSRFNSRHRTCGHLFQGRYKAVLVDPDESGVILRVADYIHLNPARARMLDRENPDLDAYAWGSHPLYAGKGAEPPAWFESRRVWRGLDMDPQSTDSAKAYRARMRARVAEVLDTRNRKRLDEEWQGLRRGWFLGAKEFRTRLDRVLKKALVTAKAESHHGPAKESAEEAEAVEILKKGRKALDLREEEIGEMKMSDPRKESLAWLLKTRTTRKNEWIVSRLGGDHLSYATRAARNFREGATTEHAAIKKLFDYLD